MRSRIAFRAGTGLLFTLVWLVISFASVFAQTPTSKTPASTPKSTPPATPQATPVAQPTPFQVPRVPESTPASPATGAPSPAASPSSVPLGTQIDQNLNPLTLDEALRLAKVQASSYQQAALNERIAAEDVKQAQAAFLPKVSAPLSYIYTSPAIGLKPGEPRAPSFIANNAISEYQAFVNVAGARCIIPNNRASPPNKPGLLEAAPTGTEVARRAVRQSLH